ncbi:acyl-phosphate glycerol 3-phosphate acyltransferase [Magnetospirillum sp. ME-1]|uniref:lysophospholipid acyltransferase family protein n=1 Tax=Magnetospirillum sp. ME-1 TaxID=1639348 RepID=UPI000A179DA0|nr:lysophospholipid acyltransferase family protein [Magnetospirillum sp. ME-1]ARJ66357.1 acyl-phosphate glycerol 3-phosphate acyltransferase [Magnetospirillum sp. ME-1]
MISVPVAVLRFLGFVLWTLVLIPPFLVLRLVSRPRIPAYTRVYWRGVMAIIGYDVVVRGRPVENGSPVLYVANHASYLDIIVLGSLLRAYFVAKSEVAGWAGFGFLARISRTVFIERSRGATARERNGLLTRFDLGESLILFAEGTSNDGNQVMPFKSSFFSVAEGEVRGTDGLPQPVSVQPVSVAYTRLDGLPITRALRPHLAWYGDMTLAPHLIGALGMGRITVEVEFHPPVTVAQFGSRKGLSAHCHKVISDGLTRMLAGRPAANS